LFEACGHLVAQLEELEMQVDDQKWRDILAETKAGIEASTLPDADRPALSFGDALQLMRDRPDTYLLLQQGKFAVVTGTTACSTTPHPIEDKEAHKLIARNDVRPRDPGELPRTWKTWVLKKPSPKPKPAATQKPKDPPRQTTGENTMAKDYDDRSKNRGALFKNPKKTAGETYIMSLALRPKDADDKGGDNTTSDARF
jgi:hypothetical protein